MADTTISNPCSSYDAPSGTCHLTGAACPFRRAPRECPDCSFVARVVMAPDEFQVLNVMSTAGASILGVGYLIPLIYLLWSLRYGRVAGTNPWNATGLEWQTPSPPSTENFEAPPVVAEEAYAYEEVTVA